jgi:GNAT superfamily N-acetyltransferase
MLAVSRERQGRGLGAGLLKDAMRRTAQAAEMAGIRAFAVHAKDDAAVSFYRKSDFLPPPTDSMHLFLLLKDFLSALDGSR